MIGVVIVSHGNLATEVLKTAELIVGKIEHAMAVNIDAKASMEKIHNDIEKAIKSVDSGDGVLVMTDMFGGTPSNLSLSFLGRYDVEVITGVNTPMVLRVPTAREKEKNLEDLARFIKEYGQKNITIASEILKRRVGRS
ncbi:MAG: PTS fructose transporter subunit IIA [Deltaproteobacteria bacterium]|nr:PTS fructose transporter subunit IIA [Deltaproteobacteria bacterium]NIS78564.1 PTS fructose transporter subunit IIA [Deltaproteobacteria bacterium]